MTVNDYLAKRDSEWMGQIYKFLGMSVGCVTNSMDDLERKKNYSFDVTYGTNSERSEERRVGKECRSRWSPYH